MSNPPQPFLYKLSPCHLLSTQLAGPHGAMYIIVCVCPFCPPNNWEDVLIPILRPADVESLSLWFDSRGKVIEFHNLHDHEDAHNITV